MEDDRSHEESLGLLALAQVQGVGYKTLFTIHRAGLSFTNVLLETSRAALEAQLTGAGVKGAAQISGRIIAQRDPALAAAEQSLAVLQERHVRILHHFDPQFPESLRAIQDAPGWLFADGNIEVLQRPLVTIVGTRKPSVDGWFITRCLCYLMHGTDLCTVSGLADGIDREVHLASLDVQLPTIAVLGTGIDSNYPASSAPLREAIVGAGGCVLTEYLPHEAPQRQAFVWRNRLQAGLSSVTIPAEWQLRSGTSHTVNFALKYGRVVMGVLPPGVETAEAEYLRSRDLPVFVLPQQGEELLETLYRCLGDA